MAFDIYPPVGFIFKVEFKELDDAYETDTYWQEVNGLSIDVSEFEYKEGGENRFVYTFPERPKYSNIELKRGLMPNTTVYNWCSDSIRNLDIKPTNFFITLLNDKQEPLQLYHVINAWPTKWNVSNFNAMDSQIVIESLELSYQYFSIL